MSIELEEAEDNLSTLLKKDKLCIFAGSGISVDEPASLPTWEGFIDIYRDLCKVICKENGISDFDRIIKDVSKFKKRDIVATATALSDIIKEIRKSNITMTGYTSKLTDIFAGKQYNSYHNTIVNTNYKYILTTNYDDLLEKAALANRYSSLNNRVYLHTDIRKISETIYKNESAIIHMHGTWNGIVLEEFIFTKDDYKRIKDKNPGFRILMNSIFMNYSILFVGYGSSDPHLEDIVEDINMTLEWLDSEDTVQLPKYYLLLKKEKISPIFDHIKNKNRTKVIPVDEYKDMLTFLEKLQQKHPRKRNKKK